MSESPLEIDFMMPVSNTFTISRIVIDFNCEGCIILTRQENVLGCCLVPLHTEGWKARLWCDMAQLLAFQGIIDHHVTIDCRHGKFSVLTVPADRVNNLPFAVGLCRVEVSVIHVQKFHVVRVPDSNSTIIRTACYEVPIRLAVLHAKDCLKVALFRRKFHNLPLQIVHYDCSVLRGDQNSRPLELLVLQ